MKIFLTKIRKYIKRVGIFKVIKHLVVLPFAFLFLFMFCVCVAVINNNIELARETFNNNM